MEGAQWASADAARVVQATREFLKSGGGTGLPGPATGKATPRVRLDGVLERALQSAFDGAAPQQSRRVSAPAVVARTSWAGPPKQRLSSSAHEALAEETAEQVCVSVACAAARCTDSAWYLPDAVSSSSRRLRSCTPRLRPRKPPVRMWRPGWLGWSTSW